MAKTETLMNSYAEHEPASPDKLEQRRTSSQEQRDKLNNRWLTVAMVGVLSVVGAETLIHRSNMPPLRSIDATVQPQDRGNPSLLAGRVELKYGNDPGEYNIQQEALRIAERYGNLYTGEQVQVQVR